MEILQPKPQRPRDDIVTVRCRIDIYNVIARTDEVMRRPIEKCTNEPVRRAYADIRTFKYYECPDRLETAIK